ncbi:MAG: flagellar basal body-associated FliL family protein [Opitutales bacterium]|nr:flagellar basal body-associated FliL family protein [Opitutales bacterium]
MAEDNSNDSGKAEPKQGKPWLVLALMLLIVPVVTLAITEFVVIPRLQSSMASENENRNSSPSREEGTEAISSYRFEDVVANLAGTMGTRFVNVSFEVRGRNPDMRQKIQANQPVVKDAIITALSSESIQSLEIPGGRNRLRASLIQAINESLSMDLVEELYFTEFIIQ